MSDLKTELGKVGLHAGPTTSCDARPTRKRKSPEFKRAKPIALQTLVADHGLDDTAVMLGVSPPGLKTMLAKSNCSMTIELLAGQLLHNEGKVVVVPKTRLVIARVPADKAEVVRTVLAAMDVKTYDFAE